MRDNNHPQNPLFVKYKIKPCKSKGTQNVIINKKAGSKAKNYFTLVPENRRRSKNNQGNIHYRNQTVENYNYNGSLNNESL